jgi:hypothetical protein
MNVRYCAKCGREISGPAVVDGNFRYHAKCAPPIPRKDSQKVAPVLDITNHRLKRQTSGLLRETDGILSLINDPPLTPIA